jgi:3-oxoacyl-[acyl-carrier protein] reductase
MAASNVALIGCYATSKAGLIGLSGTLAREYGERGVTSNVLLLGLLAGGMASGAEAGAASPTNRETWRKLCPVRREGELAEVSGLVAFLASQAASFVNGQAIAVSGGMDWIP